MSAEHPGRVGIILSDGTEVQGFEEYRIRQDIRVAGGSFTAVLAPVRDAGLASRVIAAQEVTLTVDGVPQIVGRVGEVDARASRNGSQMAISGMDLLGIACRSSLPLGFSAAGMTCREALAAALATIFDDDAPEVIGSNDANRELVSTRRHREYRHRVAEATAGYEWTIGNRNLCEEYMQFLEEAGRVRLVRETRETIVPDRDQRELLPMPGEKIGSWVSRLCEHHRLLCWSTADGRIVLGRPRYDQVVIPLRWGSPGQEGTIQDGGPLLRPIDAVARQQVAGRVGRRGESAICAEVTDDTLWAAGWRTLDVQVDESLRDLHAAQAKAARLIHDSQLEWWSYRMRLAGHAVGDRLPSIDMMFHVADPRWGVEADLYCVAREFAKSRMAGTTTELTLVRPNLLAA